MEQTIIDFFAKSSELILQNRLPTSQLPSTPLNTSLNQNTTRFQLSFARKVDFARTLPSDWTLHNHKLLVLEFFVCSKSTAEKFLAEQWTFQISPDSHERLDDTIDSPSTLYKKLSVLLRTISLLTVTLPLYQKIFRERGSSCLSQSYMIEYSVSYSKDTLSTWHPSVYQNKDLETYSGCDFVLPGRTFSFKVEYSKSLGFLKRNLEDEFERVEAEENVVQWKKTSCVRRAFSDNIYNKGVRTQDVVFYGESMPVGNPFEDGEGFFSSLMEVMPRRRVQSDASKKELIPRIWDMTKVPDASKLKIKTLESESFGEGDIFLCENDEEKFTEVLSWKDISMRNQSPTRIVFQQKDPDGSSGLPILRKMSEDCDKNRMKISMNTKPIEKIIEHTHDDKVAELLNSIEDLKMLSKRQESARSEQEKVEICESSEMVNEKGLRFENAFKHKREPSEDVCNPFGDMNELKQLYMQIKRLNSAK